MPRPIPDNVPLRTVHSFVIRAGRMTEAQQAARDRMWPSCGLAVTSGPLDSLSVFGRQAPLVLEIGFGMGSSLVEMAKAAPEKNFVGVEVHPPGIGNLLKLVEQEGLTNMRVYQADAKVVLEQCIANGQLDCIQIFFPDPWHKTRHHKRRLIQSAFINELRPKLATGGILHLATDWEPYALQMMEVLSAAPGFRNAFGEGIYATEHARPSTKFEQRGQKLGHGVWDLMFLATANTTSPTANTA
jgi:tRNA (guanine-N7-)-methyltransferase